jgi:hypothetical protein
MWLDRLTLAQPQWRKAVGDALLAIGADNEACAQVVVDFFEHAKSAPQFLEVAQLLLAKAGPRSPLMELARELGDLERRAAAANSRPAGVVLLAPDVEYVMLGTTDELLAEARRSVAFGKQRIGGTHALDWLSDMAERTSWVRAELPKVAAALLQSDVADERKAAIGMAIQRPADAKLAKVFQELLLRNPPWLDEPFAWIPGDRALGKTWRTHIAWLAQPKR